MKNKFNIWVLIAATFFFSGCATTGTVKNMKGEGLTRIYHYSYEQVYNAAIETVRDQAMEILEKNMQEGSIIAKKGAGFSSYGERIAIYVYKVEEMKTKVEVISMKVLATNIFAKDWTNILFEGIAKNLSTPKSI